MILSSAPYFLLLQFLISIESGQSIDYGAALSKSILFFEGQRSGRLPADQRMMWRGDSALGDGSDLNVDLTGGYYDAGDNIKFGFPMAFTTTMLAWSVVEFGDSMPPGELRNALVAIRWATDYLLKTVAQANRIFVQVGEPSSDHGCWERPEDMDTSRKAYVVQAPQPASDIAGETAAALAASSIAFKRSDPSYSQTLLRNAVAAFDYADTYRGAYSNTKEINDGACPFYCHFDGYQDELLWGASWLRRATQNDSYLSYMQANAKTLGAGENNFEFGWDDKHAGFNVLVSKEFLDGTAAAFQSYKQFADEFVCSLIPGASAAPVHRSPGGLIYKPGGSNLQHVTSIAFLLLAYANYLSRPAAAAADCSGVSVRAEELRAQAKRQVDYILGENPLGLSYMVGFGQRYPEYIHHRGSSVASIRDHPSRIGCREGSAYFNASTPNPNVLVGAVVGGPAEDDGYNDTRVDFKKSEPTTYINAPLVGVLAYFAADNL